MVRLVTFDVYSALADLERSLVPALRAHLGLGEARARALLALWRRTQQAGTLISNSLLKGRVPFARLTDLALQQALARFRLQADEATRHELVAAWHRLELWPEARRVLEEVRARGYAVALLSNGDDAMLQALQAHWNLAFDHIFSGEQAGVYKPHPRIYYLPLETLGLLSRDVLHVAGSSLDATGAKAAGLRCYWANRRGERPFDPAYAPDHEGADLAGLLDILPPPDHS